MNKCLLKCIKEQKWKQSVENNLFKKTRRNNLICGFVLFCLNCLQKNKQTAALSDSKPLRYV